MNHIDIVILMTVDCWSTIDTEWLDHNVVAKLDFPVYRESVSKLIELGLIRRGEITFEITEKGRVMAERILTSPPPTRRLLWT